MNNARQANANENAMRGYLKIASKAIKDATRKVELVATKAGSASQHQFLALNAATLIKGFEANSDEAQADLKAAEDALDAANAAAAALKHAKEYLEATNATYADVRAEYRGLYDPHA